MSATHRPWLRLDIEAFRHQLQQSALCNIEHVAEDVDMMADLYNSELTAIVDRLHCCRCGQLHVAPVRQTLV